MNKRPRKLVLNRETLRNLSSDQLQAAAGGFPTQFCTRVVECSATACDSYCASNCPACDLSNGCSEYPGCTTG